MFVHLANVTFNEAIVVDCYSELVLHMNVEWPAP